VVLKGFLDLECKCRQRHINTAAGKRQLDRAGRVTKLPTTDLKNIQMFVAPRPLAVPHEAEPETLVR
jgi:hypothetical protein